LFVNSYGIQYKPVAKKVFELLFNVKVLPTCLFVDKQYNFLVGSPDGLMRDNESVKNKWPHSSKDKTPHFRVVSEIIKFFIFNNNGDLQLNKKKKKLQYSNTIYT